METPRPEDSEDALQANVRRMEEAIRQGQCRQTTDVQAWMNQGAWPMSRRARRRVERQLVRQARRAEWTGRRGPAWAPVIVFLSLGLWFLSKTADEPGDPTRWIGFAFILGAIALLIRSRTRRGEGEKSRQAEPVQRAEGPALESTQTQVQTPTGPDRTRLLCDKLIQEVRASPQALREIVHRPEETIASLCKACAALREREESVRALITPEDNERLETERRELTRRIDSETDGVVRDRLSSALKSLEDQLKQRANLITSAARLEAERTRIHYALENLYTQVLTVKSADSASADVAGAGLRHSLSRLSDEVSAVAESLEAVSRTDESMLTPVTPITSESEAAFPKRAEREKS